MGTIPALPDASLPLVGTERTVVDTGATTYDVAVSEIANLSALYAHTDLGAAPERLDAAATYFTTQGAGDPKTIWFPPGTINAVAGFGFAAAATGGFAMFQRRPIAAPAGRIYEVEAEVEQVSVGGGESPVARLVVHSLKSDFTDTTGSPEAYGAPTAVLTAGQIITLTYRFASVAPYGGAAWADPGTARLLRVGVQINMKSDLSGPTASSVARIRRQTVRDVTASAALENIVTLRQRERFATASIVAGVLTLDLSAGNFFVVALTANITSVVVTGYPPTGEAQAITVVFVADGTARTITWTSPPVKWAGGTAPAFTSTVNYENWVVFAARNAVSRLAGFFQGPVAP